MALVNMTETKYAPAERAAFKTIQRQEKTFAGFALMLTVLNAVPDSLVILNQERQIVYANRAFQQVVALNGHHSPIGLRPGEALNCVHAHQTDGGCGTTEFCTTCGAVKAILQAQRGKENVQECRITRTAVSGDEEALDLRVWATPFQHNGELYTIFAVSDIGDEKRRQTLERIFFHDIRNTAGAIQGLAELLAISDDSEDIKAFDFSGLLEQASVQLIDEIDAQRQLLAAESGELAPENSLAHSLPLLQEIVNLYSRHVVSENRLLRVDSQAQNIAFVTDRALLRRVLGNMVKNGLEACQPGEMVTIGCDRFDGYARFWVHNPVHMPRQIQLQVFQRSFSTKGNGRGLGTYSMKLLSEQYLNGRVSFQSSPAEGTVFIGMYPLPEG